MLIATLNNSVICLRTIFLSFRVFLLYIYSDIEEKQTEMNDR